MIPSYRFRVGAAAFAALLLWLPLGSCVLEDSYAFDSDVVFDTVVSFGHANETNPLLIYEAPMYAQLIDDTLVLFADSQGGYLTAVNPETGRGWQVWDRGESGPGEFGGDIPTFTESGDRIYTALWFSEQASIRSISGELLTATVYNDFVPDIRTIVVGILTSGISVGRQLDPPDRQERERQQLGQRLIGVSYAQREWTFDDLPTWTTIVDEYEPGKTRTSGTDGQVVASARHNTVVFTSNGASWIAVLNADGTLRRRIETDHEFFSAFVDADERIWAQVWARNDESSGSYLVFDRDLNLIDSIIARSVRDASGDRILTMSIDEASGAVLLHVLERRQR